MLRAGSFVQKRPLRGLRASSWDSGWSIYSNWKDVYDQVKKDDEKYRYLKTIQPSADRAERQLYAWAGVMASMVEQGIATADHCRQYNYAANQLYAAQQRVWQTLLQAGYSDVPEPGRPPFFGSSLNAETVPAGTGLTGQIQDVTVVVSDDMTGVTAIYEKPWWYDQVKAFYDKLNAAGANPGLGLLPAVLLPYVGVTLVIAALAGAAYAAGWLINRANASLQEFNNLEFTKQQESYEQYSQCRSNPPTGADPAQWAQHCLEASKSIFTPGTAPSGWIQDVVGIFKWAAIAAAVGGLGYVAIKKFSK